MAMTKLGTKDREVFLKVVSNDLILINTKFNEHIKFAWQRTRDVILKERGWDIKINEIKGCEFRIKELEQKIADLKEEIDSKSMTIKQSIEFGGDARDYRHYDSASFYGISMKTEIDYSIAKRIEENIDVEITSKRIKDLANSVYRELAMAGTFEDCREIYNQFYALDFRKWGIDIPPKLTEFKNGYEAVLLADGKTPLALKESEYEKTRKNNPRVKQIEAPKEKEEVYIG